MSVQLCAGNAVNIKIKIKKMENIQSTGFGDRISLPTV